MASDSYLDYLYGWCWLLPLVSGDRVFLIGFSERERAFFNSIFIDIEIVDFPFQSNVLIVNSMSTECVAGLKIDKVRCLCILGSNKVIRNWERWLAGTFPKISNYALLPNSNPRVVVPLGHVKSIVQGLSLHRPGRRLARFAIKISKVLARLGIDRHLRKRTICIAETDWNFMPHGARHAGLDLRCGVDFERFALYLGTADDNRKTVILPLDLSTRYLLKQGFSYKSKKSLINEGKALQAMSQTTLASQVPRLFDLVELNGYVTLYQEYRSRRNKSFNSLKESSINFLAELSRFGRRAVDLNEIMRFSGLMTEREARGLGKVAYAKVRTELDRLALEGTKIWGHRSHGDFVPWNCSWTAKGFYVFDWEASLSWDIALADAFYWIVGPAIHVKHSSDPDLVTSDVISFVDEILKQADFEVFEFRIYWGIWLLSRISQKSSGIYDQLLECLAMSWN